MIYPTQRGVLILACWNTPRKNVIAASRHVTTHARFGVVRATRLGDRQRIHSCLAEDQITGLRAAHFVHGKFLDGDTYRRVSIV